MTEKNHSVRPHQLTAEDRARHQAIREEFRNRPSQEELLASGAYAGPVSHDAYTAWRLAMGRLLQERERQGLTLEDIAQRSRIDKASLIRLESGQQVNPTLFTLLQYLDAIGQRLVWTFETVGTEEGSTQTAARASAENCPVRK